MQYRVQFTDGSDKVVREMQADAGSAANAFLLVADNDWPPDAVGCACSTGTGASLPCPSPRCRRHDVAVRWPVGSSALWASTMPGRWWYRYLRASSRDLRVGRPPSCPANDASRTAGVDVDRSFPIATADGAVVGKAAG